MNNSKNEISIFEGLLYLVLTICVTAMIIYLPIILGEHELRIEVLEEKVETLMLLETGEVTE